MTVRSSALDDDSCRQFSHNLVEYPLAKYSEKCRPFRGREHGPFVPRIHSPKSTISVHESEELAGARDQAAIAAVAADPTSRDRVGDGSMTLFIAGIAEHEGQRSEARWRGEPLSVILFFFRA